MRAAIYARYSSDMQREASIEDQVHICRRLAAEQGWAPVEVYADMGMSGASHLRPGYQRLLQDARDGRFDVVVAESIDRISRDQEHIAAFHKQLGFLDIPIHTVAEGAISELHIGLKGTMSALYLKDLAQKTRRGLEGRVREGKSAGGLSYGYRIHRELRADGSGSTGERVIVPEQAAIVRRIFEAYADGQSPRTIAVDMNRDGIPGPSGKPWGMSTIYGNWRRGTGILNNELYIGRLVWNRQRFVKDPRTGRRQARPNDPTSIVVEEVPHLAIVDLQLWERVKARQTATRKAMGVPEGQREINRARRPRHLLSGLITCGVCGGGVVLVSKTRYGCATARNKGTCTMRRTVSREKLEAQVLSGLRDHLVHPDIVAEFAAAYQAEFNRLMDEAQAERAEAERSLAQVQRQIEQIIDAICEGIRHPSMNQKLAELEERKAALHRRLDASPPQPVRLHPGLAEAYRRRVAELIMALGQEANCGAADAIRALVTGIRMTPDKDGMAIDLIGELGAILALGHERRGEPNAGASDVGDEGRSTKVVSGVGFEPTTFRL